VSDPKGHTPGPWVVWALAKDSDPEERQIVTTADGEVEVCGIIEREADAELIAAAPDLLVLLEQVRDAIENRASAGRESVLRYLSTRITAQLGGK
jgi:hypothetical protein